MYSGMQEKFFVCEKKSSFFDSPEDLVDLKQRSAKRNSGRRIRTRSQQYLIQFVLTH